MTTQERTIEERKEFGLLFGASLAYDQQLMESIFDWHIQAERQKREQEVEAERERLLKLFSHKEYIKRNDLVDALTQPNNPN